MNQIYGDIKQLRKIGELEAAGELKNEHKDRLKYRRLLSRTQRQLAKVNAKIKAVTASTRSAEWKRREIDRLKLIRERMLEAIKGKLA